MALTERGAQILRALLHEHILSAQPVGSMTLCERYEFDLSPATVRAVLSELEEEGYLTHPHTSAGRLPTDKGYRFYVDSLMEIQSLTLKEETHIREVYEGRLKELESVLLQTAHMLSALSHYSGFILAPKLDKSRLRQIQIVPLEGNKALVILVTQSGLVKHKMLELERRINAKTLERATRALNERLSGMLLSEVRENILQAIEEEETLAREVTETSRMLAREIFNLQEDELYLEGASNILTLPEFSDHSKMRGLFRMIEEKRLLSSILNEQMKKGGMRVLIGEETREDAMKEMSVVSSTYKAGERVMGVLGILGPRRMEYPKMMAFVEFVGDLVNQVLSRSGEIDRGGK